MWRWRRESRGCAEDVPSTGWLPASLWGADAVGSPLLKRGVCAVLQPRLVIAIHRPLLSAGWEMGPWEMVIPWALWSLFSASDRREQEAGVSLGSERKGETQGAGLGGDPSHEAPIF